MLRRHPILIATLVLLTLAGVARWRPVAVVNAPPGPGPVVALGDSLTYGTGAQPGVDDYPTQLATRLGVPVVNAGVAGETIAQAAQRAELEVLPLRPGVVIVLLGGNDVLNKLDLETSFARLEALVRQLQADGAMVVLVGLDGVIPGSGLGGRYRRVARATGCLWVPDILDDIMGRPSLMADPLHPNARGYAQVSDRIAQALEPYLPAQ